METKKEILFPVGFHKIHSNKLFNFTMNRWISIGYARLEDMQEAAKKIKKYDDWKPEMMRIAEIAQNEDRLINAVIYYRSAEFFTMPQDADKEMLYDKYIELFYKSFKEDNVQTYNIPYKESFLPAIIIKASGEKKGTIVLHGGMDSFVEEWYLMMKYIAQNGYDVIGFEGPGQGAALLEGGLPLEIEWEKPTSAVLDYFNLEDVTLIGLSVGGWLCMRAAAFEPRIKRVIASGHTIHYMKIVPAAIRWIMTFFMRYENLFNKASFMKMEKNARMKWEISQTMRITKSETPFEANKKMATALTKENMNPEKINQDVLFFSGEEDHFIPVRLHKKQVSALVNARLVTDRIFTEKEHAQNHCQVGNIGLSLDIMLRWIAEKSNNSESGNKKLQQNG